MKLLLKCVRWLCVLSLLLCGFVSAQGERLRVLPSSAWNDLGRARGIQIGGKPGADPSIQVIFDANCPYCAKLYKVMRRDHPDIAIRWVPVAYFWPDSAELAGAILGSSDQAASMDRNFIHYDFSSKHGGYSPPHNRHFSLDVAQRELKKKWKKWGGFTPMFIVRDKNGKIFRTGWFSSNSGALNKIIDEAAPASRGLKKYDEYRAEPTHGG